ncbi:MAG: type 2 lanthipeptide synthetase LanM family protein [Cyanobacteria bacterium P01_C01_bin.72]
MNKLLLKSPAWYHALTLTERISYKSNYKNNYSDFETNKKSARSKINSWKKQPQFQQDCYWKQRLEIDSLTETEIFYIFSESIDNLCCRLQVSPAWLAEIEQAFSSSINDSIFSCNFTALLEEEKSSGFLYIVKPLINKGYQKLLGGIRSLENTQTVLPFDPETVIEILFQHLTKRLVQMLSRTMILELNVARLQGLLSGDTPQERFQSFIAQLQQRDIALALLQEYPVLVRQIKVCIDRWVEFSSEFLQHLCHDLNELQQEFNSQQELGLLTNIQWGAGDGHRGGRSVLIAEFSSNVRIVYKPRSLAVDVHFQELLAWLNQRGEHQPFKTLKVLNRDSYGWVEFVQSCECKNEKEVERFYERQGSYLALLYVLQATDFHAENLIAVGEHPVLIDIESLFHPHLPVFDSTESERLAIEIMTDSVLGVGLLPQRIWMDSESESVDVSGLGSLEGQLSPHKIPFLNKIGTDRMEIERRQIEMQGKENQPMLKGKAIDVSVHVDALTKGFITMYQLLMRYKQELIAENGVLERFAKDEVRVIVRNTYDYSSLLAESFHPDLLRDALDRDLHFERLWLNIEEKPYLAKVITAERDDLWQGDIPLFTTKPNSRDIWSSSGRQIADFCPEPSMVAVNRRIQQLNQTDLTQQLWFIRASVAVSITKQEQDNKATNIVLESHQNLSFNHVDRDILLESARSIGDRLKTLALYGKQDVAWIGLNLIEEKYWVLAPLGIDLYEGLPGITLFLAYLGKVTRDDSYTNLAKVALKTLQREIESQQESILSIGIFAGWGGIIYTLTHLAILWNDSELISQAESLVKLLPALIEEDRCFDIMAGSAGCIASLLALYRCHPSQDTLDVAIQCGEHLIAKATKMKSGIGWVLPDAGTQPLTGFSHGVAGIASVLLELTAISKRKIFHQAAMNAIAYERSVFCSQERNWPDLREFTATILGKKETQHNCLMAWCHGSSGIGLARLRSLPYLDDCQIQTEIDIALDTTWKKGFGRNHSLCHGDLGNLELFLAASLNLENSDSQAKVEHLTATILQSIDRQGWLCGVPWGVETPGLMTGLAGIGYQLLRLAQPEAVPSILMLEAPKS